MILHKCLCNIFLAVLPLLCACCSCLSCDDSQRPEEGDVESAIKALDLAVDSAGIYSDQYAARVVSFRRRSLSVGVPAKEWCNFYREMAERYLFFQSDSALNYLNLGIAQARTNGDGTLERNLLCRKAVLFAMAGLPWEGISLLDSLQTVAVGAGQRREVFESYFDVADYFYGYSLPAELLARNHSRIYILNDSLLKYDTKGRSGMTRLAYEDRTGEQVVEQLKRAFDRAVTDIEKAAFAVTISNKYQKLNNSRMRDYYWAVSAIHNIRACRMDNEALLRLAQLMADEGDWERASRYAEVAERQAGFYKSRSRQMELQGLLAKLRAHEQHSLRQRTVWLCIAASCLFVALACVVSCRLSVRVLRKRCADYGEELGQERASRNVLEHRAAVQQEGSAHFLSLCIDALFEANALRNAIVRKLKTGDVKRTVEFLENPGDNLPGNPQKLQRQFDIAFTRLYPGFNEKINALLKPEFRIVLPENELMNNELRMLALLRVGISDCQRMATILGISVNTVYFYRNRMKNRAINRDSFEADVMAIQGYA